MSAVRTLLQSLIDYAGLFPPAGLDMEAAVRNYASYRKGDDRWALGKFIVPASRLAEFERTAAPLVDPADPWPLSVLGGSDLNHDLAMILEHRYHPTRGLAIESLETKAASTVEIDHATRIPRDLATYIEIPIAAPPDNLLAAIRLVGGRAKIRTGGVKPDLFPLSIDVARFLVACSAARVPFKATAGLHHAVRCVRPLTYEKDSPTGTMHGFLNVFLAAALVQGGMNAAEGAQVLEERDPKAFVFDDRGAAWRDRRVTVVALAMSRSTFALSFGSCSFDEPIGELKELGLL
jgi:hypothetical protein